MSFYKNTVATSLTGKAFKLHKLIFNTLYPCPVQVKIKNRRAAVKFANVLQWKYIPFLFFFVFVSSVLLPGSYLFLLTLKIFYRNSLEIGIVQMVTLIFAGSCSLCQLGVTILCFKSSDIEEFINQIFIIERKCKLNFHAF